MNQITLKLYQVSWHGNDDSNNTLVYLGKNLAPYNPWKKFRETHKKIKWTLQYPDPGGNVPTALVPLL